MAKKVMRRFSRQPLKVMVMAPAFHILAQRHQEIQKLEAELASLKEDYDVEEIRIIKMLDGGAKPGPGHPPFYIETSYRKNIKWRQLFEEKLGAKAALREYSQWPQDTYKHIKFGKPPVKKKRHTEIKVY